MNNKLWKNLLFAIVLTANVIILIVVIIVLFNNNQKTQIAAVDNIAGIRTEEISENRRWRKVTTIAVNSKTAHVLAKGSRQMLLVGDDDGIMLYNAKGEQTGSIALPGGITALATDKNIIYAALPRQIIKIDGKKITEWAKFDSRTRITAITPGTAGVTETQASRLQKAHRRDAYATMAGTEKKHRRDAYATMTGGAGVPPALNKQDACATLFIADAGNRKVYCYTDTGKKLWEISGAEGEKFIIPSPYFDLAADGEGGIWVVNPGRHRIENYSSIGQYRALWTPVPPQTMLGCCNPAYFGVLSGDRFVTLEKGYIRSRLFAPSGKLIDDIVPEEDFQQGEFRYDLAVLDGDRVAILDGPGNKINIYASHKE